MQFFHNINGVTNPAKNFLRGKGGLFQQTIWNFMLIDVVNGFYARKGENNTSPNAKSIFPQIPKELRNNSEQVNNIDGFGIQFVYQMVKLMKMG